MVSSGSACNILRPHHHPHSRPHTPTSHTLAVTLTLSSLPASLSLTPSPAPSTPPGEQWGRSLLFNGSSAWFPERLKRFPELQLRAKERMRQACPRLEGFAGWHLSYFMDTPALLRKLRTFSHASDAKIIKITQARDPVATVERYVRTCISVHGTSATGGGMVALPPYDAKLPSIAADGSSWPHHANTSITEPHHKVSSVVWPRHPLAPSAASLPFARLVAENRTHTAALAAAEAKAVSWRAAHPQPNRSADDSWRAHLELWRARARLAAVMAELSARGSGGSGGGGGDGSGGGAPQRYSSASPSQRTHAEGARAQPVAASDDARSRSPGGSIDDLCLRWPQPYEALERRRCSVADVRQHWEWHARTEQGGEPRLLQFELGEFRILDRGKRLCLDWFLSGDVVGVWGTWECSGDVNQAFIANRSSRAGAALSVHNQQCLHRFQPRRHGHTGDTQSPLLLTLRPCPQDELTSPQRARLLK